MADSGAAALQIRLAQQEHWRMARTVREGTQPRTDPDAHLLREFRGEERVYENELGPYVKRLIDGAWRVETIY